MATHFYYNGHTYEIDTAAKTWSVASQYAKSLGGHLATVTSAGENSAIYSNASKSISLATAPSAPDGGGATYLWLGASDIAAEGTWRWVDGTLISAYKNWGSGALGTEPDNFKGLQDAMGMGLEAWPQPSGGIGIAGKWNDINANNVLYSVIEWDYLRGTAAADSLTGTTANDRLVGLAGNDMLNGGAGADALQGGLGNDTYVRDNAGDVITELAGQGIDVVKSSVSYILAANVENLTLTGTAGISGTGNSLSNVIAGNVGNNVLVGGTGSDTVSYATATKGVVVNLALAAVQATGAGSDKLSGFENLTGSNFNDKLTGDGSANVLNGGLGSDVLTGGGGNDTYVVNGGDTVAEAANAGTDVVQSSVSYILGANVENLTLTGTATISATGNELDNTLSGNGAGNVLDGGAGSDVLTGGAGADIFKFSSALGAGNADTIADLELGVDWIVLDSAIFRQLAASPYLAEANFSASGSAADADDFIVYDAATGALYYDADADGTDVAVQFASVTPGLELIAADFEVV